jgi:hypothetical protein
MRGYNDGFDACAGNNSFGNDDGNEDENDDNPFLTSQGNRPAINPGFDPDFDCIYDVSQIHCIPGSAQECPKPQFSAGDPEMCFPNTLVNGEWEWECPEDYHSVEDDETGQCYPDEEGCYESSGTVWRGKTATSHTACVDENYCLDHPEIEDCKPENVCDRWGHLTIEDWYCKIN